MVLAARYRVERVNSSDSAAATSGASRRSSPPRIEEAAAVGARISRPAVTATVEAEQYVTSLSRDRKVKRDGTATERISTGIGADGQAWRPLLVEELWG